MNLIHGIAITLTTLQHYSLIMSISQVTENNYLLSSNDSKLTTINSNTTANANAYVYHINTFEYKLSAIELCLLHSIEYSINHILNTNTSYKTIEQRNCVLEINIKNLNYQKLIHIFSKNYINYFMEPKYSYVCGLSCFFCSTNYNFFLYLDSILQQCYLDKCKYQIAHPTTPIIIKKQYILRS